MRRFVIGPLPEENRLFVVALRQEGGDINLEINGELVAWFTDYDDYTQLHLASIVGVNNKLGFVLGKSGEIKAV